MSWIENITHRSTAAIDRSVNVRDIRVAVTGLSRAGKTVFLTSLIANLLAMKDGLDTLPAFRAHLDKGGKGRLRGVRMMPAGVETTPRFDVMTKLSDLASDRPHWPDRTDDLAEVDLELEIAPRSGLLGWVRKLAGVPRIRLSLLDYPGEWLLDLPMLSLSFEMWSAQTVARLREEPRDRIAAPFLDFLTGINPAGNADDSLLRLGHRLYREVLHGCRDQYGLRYLQPGRFLRPGPRNDAPFLWFFPLGHVSAPPRAGSMHEMLRDRFEAYKTDMRSNFFDTHFRAFDRQIVLVDILGALHAGKSAYQDTEHAIADIAGSLAADHSNLFGLRLGGSVIDRIAFVATKADHAPELQRENLRSLLYDMVKPARQHSSIAHDAVSYHVAASIVSITDGWADRTGGTREPVVWGRELGKQDRRAYHVGAIPIIRPVDGFWSGRYFELPVFTPPVINPSGVQGIPHLGLDQILVDMIGDRL